MKITIDFEKENLTQLLKTTFFGAWVKNATKAEGDRDQAMDSFVQFVLGSAWNAGEKTRITADAQGRYSFAADFEEVLFEQIDEYDGDMFWDELVDQLARRDFYQKNPSKINKPVEGKAGEEIQTGIDRESEKYDKEFEERGVERLRLVK